MINDNVSIIRLELEGNEEANEGKGLKLAFDELNMVTALRSMGTKKWIPYDETAKKNIEIIFE